MSVGAKVAMSAVIGGTAEKLGGGKFANGAVTGAFVMMLNHLGKHGKGRSSIPHYDELPPVNNTKNWEYARVEGVDYLFFDNQWIDLPPNDIIYRGKDPDPLGTGDIEVTIPRETIAVYNHIKKQEVLWGTLTGAGIESISSIAKTLHNLSVHGVRISPVGFTISYISGSSARVLYMDLQMRKHDLQVDDLRRR